MPALQRITKPITTLLAGMMGMVLVVPASACCGGPSAKGLVNAKTACCDTQQSDAATCGCSSAPLYANVPSACCAILGNSDCDVRAGWQRCSCAASPMPLTAGEPLTTAKDIPPANLVATAAQAASQLAIRRTPIAALRDVFSPGPEITALFCRWLE